LRTADEVYRPVFAVMAYAGLRFGEARDLEWADVRLDDPPGGWLVVRRGGSGETTKTGRVRRIPLHPALREMLAAMPQRDERLLYLERRPRLDPHGWFPLAERQTLMTLKRLCRESGFEGDERFKLHTLRHVFCSVCARSNVPFKYALVWLGHRKSEMLDYYFHAFDETAAAAMRTIKYPDAAVHAPADGEDYSI
jgi:integrase